MTDCGCEKTRRDLEEYLRHEVCTTEASDIRDHLANCPACRDEAVVSRTLTEVIARSCREAAPEQLRDLVLVRLREAQATH